MKTLSKAEIRDLIVGATIMGTGGGGSPEDGLKSLMTLENQGKKLQIASLDELKSDDIIASPYFVGSVAPKKRGKNPRKAIIGDPIAAAFKLLENRLGKKIKATVAAELGGSNTPASIAIAAKLGLPAIDGDLMGRAGPELNQSTIHIFSYSMVPSAVVSPTGNQFLVESYSGINDYEAIARYASVISGGHVGVVDSPLDVSRAQQCVIKGTISKCIDIGKARREAIERKHADPTDTILEELKNGQKIFEGTISKYAWRDEKGFLFGEAYVSGTGQYKGKILKSAIMNEHIMCWIDNKPAVMPPDLIIFLEPNTGLGITNDKLVKGRKVIVLGASVDNVWRKKKGIELFGPRHFGHPYDYKPFERLH